MIDIAQLVQDVIDGKENPLKAYAILKDFQKQIAQGVSEVEEYAFEEAEKYGEKTFQAMNYEFEVRQGGRRYDFKSIDKWNKVNSELKSLESLYKQAAMAYEKGKTIIDDDGEIVPIPEFKHSKNSLVVRAKK